MRRADRAAVVVLSLTAALVLLPRPAPPQPTAAAQPRSTPVGHTTLVCPSTDQPATTTAAVTALPRRREPATAPSSPVRLSAGGSRLGELDRRGETWSAGVAALGDGLQVSADGPLAAGLEAASAAVSADGTRGLAVAACPAPAAHWWFVGAASTPARSEVLELANPTTGTAVVDVAFHGPRGPLGRAATGLAVGPGERTLLPLADVVPGARSVAVEVTARQGRVAAALRETAREGLDPAGVDLLPPAAAARRTAVVTGVPGRADTHTLSVLNAGTGAAVVDVEVLGPRGAFTPTSLESGLRVPARGVAETSVPAAVLDGAAAGIRLTSHQPVTAAVRSTGGQRLTDQSFAAAGEPVGTLAGTPALPRLDGELVLSGAGDTAAIVDVVTYSDAGAPPRRRTLDVRAGQTRSVPLPDAASSVVVRAGGSGPVAAAVLWSRPDDDGTLTGGFPLRPARLTVERPPVRYRLVPAQPS